MNLLNIFIIISDNFINKNKFDNISFEINIF